MALIVAGWRVGGSEESPPSGALTGIVPVPPDRTEPAEPTADTGSRPPPPASKGSAADNRHLHPPIEPYARGEMDTGEGHVVY
jgi:hypothetical protein